MDGSPFAWGVASERGTVSKSPMTQLEPIRLSDEQRGAFAREGYLVLDSVISEAELATLEPWFDRFLRGEIRGMARDLCDMSGPYDRPFEEFDIVNAVLPRTYAPALQGNVFELRAAAIAAQLIGADLALDYDQFLTKRPRREDAVFAWHQDLGYWPTGTPDTRTATCSLALDDANVENGCLRVVPGSHREPELRPHRPVLASAAKSGPRDASHALTIELGEADAVLHLPVRRGGMTIHNERIVHGSGGNPSPGWRRTYVVAFRSRATVAYERAIGFTHSHNDTIQWETHLDALAGAAPQS